MIFHNLTSRIRWFLGSEKDLSKKYLVSHKCNKSFIYLLELLNNDITIIVILNVDVQSKNGGNKLWREACQSIAC